MTYEKILAFIMITVMVIAPLPNTAVHADVSVQGQVAGQVSLGKNNSTVDLQLTAVANESTNTTGSINISITGSSDHTSATGQGSLSLAVQTENPPDFHLSVQGSSNFNAGNFTSTMQVQLYANLSGGGGSIYMLESVKHLPLANPIIATTTIITATTTITATTIIATTTTFVNPPSPPISNMTGAMTLSVNLSEQKSGWINATNGHIVDDVNGAFNLSNGAAIIGMMGDIAGTIKYHSETTIINETRVKDSTTNITFNSGNQQVDQQVAVMLYQYLSTYLVGGVNSTVTVQLVGTSIIIHSHSVSQVFSINLPRPPNIPGFNIPGPGPISNVSLSEEELNATMIPVFYENASGHATYSLTVEGVPSQSVIVASGEFSGSVSGINPESLSFFPTNIKVNGQLNGDRATLALHLEGDGDPTIPFEMVKTLLLAFKHANCNNVEVNVSMQTDGSIHFYNAVTGADLGTTLDVTCDNLNQLKHVIVAPEGTTVKSPKQGVVEIHGKGELEVGMGAVMSAKIVKVNTSKLIVKTGSVILTAPKTIHIEAHGVGHVIVHVLEHSLIKGQLEVESLAKSEVDNIAGQYGFTALGPGVKIVGIGKGAARITLPLNESASGVAVLEISSNGSTKLISNVHVNANGTVTFTTESFSTFIPVASAQTTTTTTLTCCTTTITTSGTSSSSTETTTGAGGTSTQSTSGTGSTESTTTSEGGSNAGLIAGVIILIIIILAGAYYAMRK